MNAHLNSLMEKEVSRGEFLGVIGLAAASVFGLGTILKLVTGKSLDRHTGMSSSGYGSSPYGGANESR